MPDETWRDGESIESTVARLVDGARSAVSSEALLDKCCRRLVAGDLPLWRVALFIRELHPSLVGRAYFWRAGEKVDVLDARFEVAA